MIKGTYLSAEAKLKLSIANSEVGNSMPYCHRVATAETRRKISNFLKGGAPWNKGLKNVYTEETLSRISRSLKGRAPWNKGLKNIYTDETRRKISLSLKGKLISEETKQKIKVSAKNNPNFGMRGKKHSEETKLKMSKSKLGKSSINKGVYGVFHQSIETRTKISDNAKINSNFGMRGKHLSAEAKLKISSFNI